MITIRQEQLQTMSGGRDLRCYDEDLGCYVGVRRRTDLELTLGQYDEGLVRACVKLWEKGAEGEFRLIMGTEAMLFRAYVVGVFDAAHPVLTFRIVGQSRLVNMEEKMKKTKVLNRFYVASDKMMSFSEQGTVNTGEPTRRVDVTDFSERPRARHTRWAKHTLAQAIEHAREILEQDPSKSEVAIVRIVKVVRRREMPIVVEDVK